MNHESLLTAGPPIADADRLVWMFTTGVDKRAWETSFKRRSPKFKGYDQALTVGYSWLFPMKSNKGYSAKKGSMIFYDIVVKILITKTSWILKSCFLVFHGILDSFLDMHFIVDNTVG